MSGAQVLDSVWLRRHPLPVHPEDTDKNSRGRLMLVGGSTLVPGGLTLTATAAFRAGAGKVQIALPEPLAIPTGMAMPESGIFGLPTGPDGEIADCSPVADKLAPCDCLALGPAVGTTEAGGVILDSLLPHAGSAPVIIDAAAVCAGINPRTASPPFPAAPS